MRLLHDLLYDRDFRESLRSGRTVLSTELRDLLGRTDLDEAESMAVHIHRSLLYGGSSHGDGLLKLFPRTVALLEEQGASISEHAWEFLGSPEHGSFRVLPYCGRGRSLPEAFYSWATRHPGFEGIEDIILFEARLAVAALLVTTPEPGFDVGPIMTHRGGIWFALQHMSHDRAGLVGGWSVPPDGTHLLVAATARGLVSGPVGPHVAQLISEPVDPEELPPATRRALHRLGLA